MSKVNDVVVVGGGTAGWLTALAINKMHPDLNVSLIESKEIGILGAGEGSTPQLINFLKILEIPLSDIIKNCDATIKNGIKFTNWNNDGNYYYHAFNPLLDDSIGFEARQSVNQMLHPIFIGNIIKDGTFKDIDFMGKLSEEGKVPFISKDDNVSEYAVHFNALKFANRLKEIGVARGISLIEGTILNISLNEDNNVNSLTLDSGNIIKCDFVFDCSGFHRLIIGKVYDAKWKSYNSFLPNDSAVPFFIDMSKDIPPYTEAIAMKYGWIWKIPLQSRFGCGYVYDSSLISEDQAIQEIEEFLGYSPEYPRKNKGGFKFNAGCYEEPWTKNCIAIGLASNFLEPLEATSILASILMLKQIIGKQEWLTENTDQLRKEFNKFALEMNNSYADFVYFHYMGKRKDTKFWEKFSYDNASDNIKSKINSWKERLPDKRDGDTYWSFESWFVCALGLGHVNTELANNYIKEYKDGLSRYDECVGVQSERIFRCLKHRTFLEELNEI